MSQRYEKWKRWFDEICLDVQALLTMRHVYYELGGIFSENPALQRPSLFYDYLATTYSTSALMGVRRQVKSDRDSISAARLLEEMKRTPEEITRERYAALHGQGPAAAGGRGLDLFTGAGKGHLKSSVVDEDLRRLKELGERCEHYVDRRIAHLDRKGVRTPPKYLDLNRCIDFLEEFIVKYQLLFRTGYSESFTPKVRGDWKEIFTIPWIEG